MAAYFAALDPMTLVRALPGNVAQGIIWGIMALGVYITFRILDFADLTVDGSLATGGAVAVMLIRAGVNPALALVFAFLAGMAAGFVTGVLHTFFGIPGILASILTHRTLLRKPWHYGKIQPGGQCHAVQTGCFSSLCNRRRQLDLLPEINPCSTDPDRTLLLVLRNRTRSIHPCDRM